MSIVQTVNLTKLNQNPAQENQYIYNFPSTQNFTSSNKVALTQFNINNSFYNISEERNNNTIQFTWHAGNASKTYTYVFMDGFYTYSQINNAIRNFCLLNNLYMIDGNNNNKPVHYWELMENSIAYKAQMDVYLLPTIEEANNANLLIPRFSASQILKDPTLEASFENTWTLSDTAGKTPQFKFTSPAFGSILGFSTGTYPPVADILSERQYLSTFAPTLSPVSSIFLSTNLISSSFSNPSNIISNTPIDVEYGLTVKHTIPDLLYLSIVPGSYNQIQINLLRNDYSPLNILDKDVIIQLSIMMEQ